MNLIERIMKLKNEMMKKDIDDRICQYPKCKLQANYNNYQIKVGF